MHTSFLSVIGTAAVVATLIAVIYYTSETHKLRKEAQKQNELTLRPLIMPVAINPFSEYVLKLINIGKSPAFNISIDSDEDLEDIHSWEPASSQNFLAPGEDGRWDCSPMSPGEKTKNRDIVLDIQYDNVEGDVFYTKVRINFRHEEQEFLNTGRASQR
jgi:hypothetical protein